MHASKPAASLGSAWHSSQQQQVEPAAQGRLLHPSLADGRHLVGAGLTALECWGQLLYVEQDTGMLRIHEDSSMSAHLERLGISFLHLYDAVAQDLVAWDAAQRHAQAGRQAAAAAAPAPGSSPSGRQQAASGSAAASKAAQASPAPASLPQGSTGASLPSERAPMPYASARVQAEASREAVQPAAAAAPAPRHPHGKGCLLCAKEDEAAEQQANLLKLCAWTNAVNNGEIDSDDEEVRS